MRAAGVTRAIVEMVVNQGGAGSPISHYDHEGADEKRTALTNVPDLNAVLSDLDGDGTDEIVAPQMIGEVVDASRPQATIPEGFDFPRGTDVPSSAHLSGTWRPDRVA
jgi:hypothetical protein